MANSLSKKDREFVETMVETGNATQAVKDVYGIKDDNYAGVKGHRLIRTDKIQNAIQEALPDELLARVHLEGLQATIGEDKPDFNVRHRYLDSAYKVKGTYAPDKSINLDIQASVTDPKAIELAKEYEEKLKESL